MAAEGSVDVLASCRVSHPTPLSEQEAEAGRPYIRPVITLKMDP